jgi:hypothetical protein
MASTPGGGDVVAPGRGDRERGAPGRLLIAVALAGYGLYRALYVPAMLVGAPVPLLLAGFIVQAVLGIVAGVAVWRGARSAALLVVLLGASIAATALLEAFAFGILAYLRALLEAVAAIAVALLIAAYVKPDGEATSTRGRRLG